MPGLTLVCDFGAPIEDQLLARLSYKEERIHEGEASTILWHDRELALLSSGYPEYPVTTHEAPDHLICIEGRIHEAPEVPWYQSVAAIAADILVGESHNVARASRRLAEIDGDFVVAFQDRRSRDVVIFNDSLGRLPLYVYRTDSTLIVSRDLSLVMRTTGRVNFDRLAVAEYLLYGYPLGTRTLFSDIERLTGAATIQIRHHPRQIRLSNLLVSCVASDPNITRATLEDTARELSYAFAKACFRRVHTTGATILSLSGGLDSRSVAAVLSTKRVPFVAVTQSANPRDADTRIAAKVASVLRLNWRAIRLSRPTGADLFRLLRLKSGMNYLGMAFILPFFDTLEHEFGRGMMLLTGDGGDKILPCHGPRIGITSRQALVRYVLANHEVLPLSTVVALTGVARLDILAALEARIASYPEDNLADKYVHFILFERAFKWLFEGEDRNRHFFWSDTPFYGRKPFFLAMSCPAQFKENYLLYRLFMESLSPELVDVESTTFGPSLRRERYPISQFARSLREQARELMPRRLKRKWRALREPPVTQAALGCIREQLAPSSPVTAYLSPSHTNVVLGQLDLTQSYMLLTLTAAIEYFTTGKSTLERYRHTCF